MADTADRSLDDPQPDEAESGESGNGGDDDLVADEGVNEGTREIVEE